MFVMRLAKDLGRTLEEMLEISTLEFVLWAAFYKHEQQQQQGRMRASGRKHNR